MAVDTSHDPGDRMRVICRVRPRLQHEVGDGEYDETLQVEHAESFVRVRKNAWDRPEAFTFDSVLPVEASQRRVYDALCLPVVESVLAGKNGAVLAYGQTGTGKTYSLMHQGGKPASSERGVVIRATEEIFARARIDTPNVETKVVVTFVQIYNEEVYDLLVDESSQTSAHTKHGTTTPLRLAECDGEIFADGAAARIIISPSDIIAIMKQARKHRKTANQHLNASSSRSHAILTIYVSRETIGRSMNDSSTRSVCRVSKLTIVDLAGSERVKKTQTNNSTQIAEAGFINKSLAALGNCVHVLAEQSGRSRKSSIESNSTSNPYHIPFRDSKLTRLLKDCFGGGCRTSLLVTCSADPKHTHETVTSLRFGQRAMNVDTIVKSHQGNLTEYKAAVKRQTQEVDRLQFQLEESLAIARNAKAEAFAELERERIKIEQASNHDRERRIAIEKARLEDDADQKAKVMVREVTRKVTGMLDMERERMVREFQAEKSQSDGVSQSTLEDMEKVKIERDTLAKERDKLAVALASTTQALDTALKRCTELERIVGDENKKTEQLNSRALEAESLVDKLAARLAKYAQSTSATKIEEEQEEEEIVKKKDATEQPEDKDVAHWSTALAAALQKKEIFEIKNAALHLARLASEQSRHLSIANSGALLNSLFTLVEEFINKDTDGQYDEQTVKACLSILANVASSPECHFCFVDDDQKIEILIQILENKAVTSTRQTKLLVVGCFANLMGNPRLKQVLVDRGVFACCMKIAATQETINNSALSSSFSELRAQATRAVSNFCARHPGAGDAVMDVEGALQGLIDAAGDGVLPATRKHAVLALYHMTRRSDLVIKIKSAGGISALKKAVDKTDSEETFVLANRCLRALENGVGG